MGRMGRDINHIIIIDNSPHSYAFNPENAIPCQSWFNDKNDRELLDLLPRLEELSHPNVTDVKIKLSELGISGAEALNLEIAQFRNEEECESETESWNGQNVGGELS